ncbi:MAG: ATPase, T2SS/T4P/T4SS family [Myxococcota bacterium]|nr:ATPase, T2SS/T4P/T4SS family [Myxococcota bacterium]
MMDPLTALRVAPGMVLLAGPPRSGKNTAAMAMLQALDLSTLSAATIELSPRRSLDGVQQTMVADHDGQLAMLQRLMDLDTDLIYVRALCDSALTQCALESAVSRRIISTIEVDRATDALGRLSDHGPSPWLVCEAVRVVQSQRWVRRLCTACRRPTTISGSILGRAGPTVVFEPVGCEACRDGFRGRRLVVERFALDHSPLGIAIRRDFLAGIRGEALHSAAREAGLITLREAAIGLVLAGDTSVAEALQETPPS